MPEDLNEDYFILQSECACEYQDPREVKERFIQFARILKYEITMREAEQLLLTKENADRLQSLISKLEAYYSSDEWKRNFADDEAICSRKSCRAAFCLKTGFTIFWRNTRRHQNDTMHQLLCS